MSAVPSIEHVLPNETLSAIFEILPLPVLADIARVSRHFKAVAERVLYSAIHVRDTISTTDSHPWRTTRCCDSLLQRPHLVESIRTFHIRWHTTERTSLSALNLEPASNKLAATLRTLHFLDSLELALGPANMAAAHRTHLHPIERIIRGCYFPHLRSCSFGADWAKGVQSYSTILDSFLSSVPLLRHLKLSDHHEALKLRSDALPNLSSFRGSTDTAAYILPGRPVQSLSLIGQDSDVTRDNLPRFTHTTTPLRFLDLSAMSVRPILLRNIATYLPMVEVIRIRLTLRHTLHYALSGIRLLTGLSPVLHVFSRLTLLDLSPTVVAGLPQSNGDEESALCREWSRACPSLRRVIFPSQMEWAIGHDGVWGPVD
ncbi:uncharacterized protein BT62DRAFT_971128 [Guyanagaster necrorhizus]|uniref:F-box domain-containing protein n=1 Tax=Guyanagaster necrorhizus TaxID=856835 RepID=A0A9P8AQS7_9AGAR|nr:uncharacterized protein BT62DRAFT_971128 [Guyanagaster necrorhizus MCA 3950]KAG7444439.1 hypothetical protein BT62DRAFT_971128 [Guyanagaster necrorhizus MCA 3950]